MKISIFSEVRKIDQMSDVNQCFQRYSLIKTLHKKNIFNTTLHFEVKKNLKLLKVNSFFQENMSVKMKIIAHNNTSLLHMFLCCER